MIRLLDIIFSLLLLTVTCIPMVFIAIAIMLEDGLPVLFKQTRVGQGCKHFKIYKFRSMRVTDSASSGGEVRTKSAGVTDKEAARKDFITTSVNDKRITRIGRFIRKVHLDELPQLINVFRGEMSLVGVRPDTPAQEVDYDADYWLKRHRYKPGITGLAQVMNKDGGMSGRSGWESVWLDDRSLALYFSVLFKTIAKVLKRDSF